MQYTKDLSTPKSQQKKKLCNGFKHYRNLVTKLSRTNKPSIIIIILQTTKKNRLKTWEGNKLPRNSNKKDNRTVTCLSVDEIAETDPFLISNRLNKVFLNHCTKN